MGLGIVSCQKQEIAPNTDEGIEIPVWEESARIGEDDVVVDDGGGIGGEITDPNEDNDDNADPDSDPNGEGDNGKTKKRKGQN